MKKYAIIETWNGQGYSDANEILHIKYFTNDAQALEHCKELATEQAKEFLEDLFGVTDDIDDLLDVCDSGVNYFAKNDVDDSGCIHFVELHTDSFAVEMHCNVNEIFVLTEEEYKHSLNEAVKNADQDELDDFDLDADRVFIGAYNDEYDRQFEIISEDKIDFDDLEIVGGDGVEFELWEHKDSGGIYRVEIEIVRDFDNIKKQ